MSEQHPDEISPGVQQDMDWAAGYLYGPHLHPSALIPEGCAGIELGWENARPLHRLIDALRIDFRDPAYMAFATQLRELVVSDGYNQQNGMLPDAFIQAFKDGLVLCGLPEHALPEVEAVQYNYRYRGGILKITLQGLRLYDPARQRGEMYISSYLVGTEPDGRRVAIARLMHIKGRDQRAVTFRGVLPTDTGAAEASEQHYSMELVEGYDLSQLKPEDYILISCQGMAGRAAP